MKYQPQPLGNELYDGDQVNVIIDTINPLLVTAGNPVPQLQREIPGYRLLTGDKMNKISQALVALGYSTPVTANNQGGLTLGHRLFTGDLLNKMALSAGQGAYPNTGGGNLAP